MLFSYLLVAYVFFVSLFKGDEVIEWNGRSLQGKSTQEVCDVIEESRHESQIELIVSRPLSVNRKAAQTSWRQSHSPIRAQTRQYLHKGSQFWLWIFLNDLLTTTFCWLIIRWEKLRSFANWKTFLSALESEKHPRKEMGSNKNFLLFFSRIPRVL